MLTGRYQLTKHNNGAKKMEIFHILKLQLLTTLVLIKHFYKSLRMLLIIRLLTKWTCLILLEVWEVWVVNLFNLMPELVVLQELIKGKRAVNVDITIIIKKLSI